jgi:hypothetical protein
MRSKHHFVLSLLTALALTPFVDTAFSTPVLVVGMTALGVFVDFDHFLIAMHNSGSVRALRWSLAHPVKALVAQDEIFEATEVWPLERLLSHAVIAGGLVGGALAAGFDGLAVASGVVLYVHVLSDLAWDVSRQDRYHERVRDAS